MKVQLYYTGKTQQKYLQEGEALYYKRLKHYLPIAVEVIPDVKQAAKLSTPVLQRAEGERLLSKIQPNDHLILLDEGGKQFRSLEFADYLSKCLHLPARRLVFVVGGAFGFAPPVYERADSTLSLSKMTFSHQMVRLFLAEQLYRAVTIMNNEKYHNE